MKNGSEKMKKNRNIPFGYTMQKGEIVEEPTESQAVKDIFKLYLDGKSMSELARQMSINQISYNGITFDWNKNMVKRILENEKYLGKDAAEKSGVAALEYADVATLKNQIASVLTFLSGESKIADNPNKVAKKVESVSDAVGVTIALGLGSFFCILFLNNSLRFLRSFLGFSPDFRIILSIIVRTMTISKSNPNTIRIPIRVSLPPIAIFSESSDESAAMNINHLTKALKARLRRKA